MLNLVLPPPPTHPIKISGYAIMLHRPTEGVPANSAVRKIFSVHWGQSAPIQTWNLQAFYLVAKQSKNLHVEISGSRNYITTAASLCVRVRVPHKDATVFKSAVSYTLLYNKIQCMQKRYILKKSPTRADAVDSH